MHVVICGFSRSGTTLLYNLLLNTVRNHTFLDHEVSALGHLDDDDLVTKRPLDIFNVERIANGKRMRGRDVRFLMMLRDPRDMLLSRHEKVADDYFMDADHCYFLGDGKVAKTNPGILPTFEKLISLAATPALDGRLFCIKYEEFVDNLDAAQSRFEDAFGFAFSKPLSAFYRPETLAAPDFRTADGMAAALNGIRPVDGGSRGRWMNDPERIVSQFIKHPALFDMLEALGYETDRSWFDDLKRQAGAGVSEVAGGA